MKGMSGVFPPFVLRSDQPGLPKKVDVLRVFGQWGEFTFPAGNAAGRQYLAAAAVIGIQPDRILFDALTAAVEATVARAAQLGGTAQ